MSPPLDADRVNAFVGSLQFAQVPNTAACYLEMQSGHQIGTERVVSMFLHRFKPPVCIFCHSSHIEGTGALIVNDTNGMDRKGFQCPDDKDRYFFFSLCSCAKLADAPESVQDRIARKIRIGLQQMGVVQ